jgi:ribonuclease P protein component
VRRSSATRFDKSRRVRKRSDYVEIQSQGRRVSTARFVIVLRARSVQRSARARLGITVSRKTGGAVLRNRAKRLVREAFRRTEELWAPGLDVVVIVKQLPDGLKLNDVVSEWERARAAVARRTSEAFEDLSFSLAAANGPDKVPDRP